MPSFSLAYSRFADVYDTLMRDVDYNAWAAYLDALLHAAAIDKAALVDCACGTGALSTRLAQYGYTVTGIDNSEDMLRIAGENARRLGLNIPFVCQDMRALLLHRQAAAINCACDGINYLLRLEDVRAFFKAAYTALKPGGVLLFDSSTAYKFEALLHGNVFAETERACAYIWRNNYDAASRLIEMELTCFVHKLGESYERFDERHVQRAHTEQELCAALTEAGFCDIAVYAAFTTKKPSLTAQRIQFVAIKP